jgi:hypothetical protein
MADKNINFNIKVNNKELDLTKVSFKQFNEIIKQAKKDLQALPLTDPRYKQLVTDINAAEKAWKDAKKSSSEFGDEQEKGAESVKSYRSQIRQATEDLIKLENQYGKNSTEADNQRKKIGELRDAQEELTRTTQDLDDTLAALPGPIGQVGQGLQQLESIGQNAGSAFAKLGLGFKSLDQAIKTSGVGALVLLIVTLVAALVDATKKSEPLQRAFAVMGDAIGALFDAIKPLTDFIINVFVGAIELAAAAINGLASLFGGVNKGFKQQSLELEKQLAFQQAVLSGYNSALSENLTERLKIENDYAKRSKEIADATYKNELDRNRDSLLAKEEYNNRLNVLELKQIQDRARRQNELDKIINDAEITATDNQREVQRRQIDFDEAFNLVENNMLMDQNKKKLENVKQNIKDIQNSNISNKAELLKILQDSQSELGELEVYYRDKTDFIYTQDGERRLQKEREFAREDIAIRNQRANEILELTTSLIKEENARNLQVAKDRLVTIKEEQRLEREQVALTGVSTKNLKQKQAAELKLVQEEIRKAQLQFDASLIQIEIDKQNRLVTEAGIGTKEYFNARKEVAQKEFEKEVLLADNNANLIENARTKLWNNLIQIDKDGLAQMSAQVQAEYDSMYEGTVQFFDKQRELENANYLVQQANARGNYDMLEALAKQHTKNLAMIDVAQLQSKADIEGRKAATVTAILDEYFVYTREQENLQYQAQIKAAGDNLALIETINMEHAQKMRDIDAQQYEAKKQVYLAIIDLTAQFGQTLNQIGNVMMEQAQGRDKKQFDNAKAVAIAGIGIEKAAALLSILANTKIANAKAIAAFPLTFGQPWVAINTISGILSAASIIAGAVSSISQINSQQFQAKETSTSGGGSGGNGMGRGYADGGIIKGPGTSKSDSIPARLSNGEAVMTSGAVTMFGPMLSMMNQMGGGTSFAPNALTVRPDNPKTNNPAQEQSLIVKTYVVENEMTSIQQRQSRLKDLSTL